MDRAPHNGIGHSEYGGQSRETADDYVESPPELVAEVAYSTRAIDLHRKRLDYQRASVREYVVLSIEQPEVIWFGFRPRGSIVPDADGVWGSRVFPGLLIGVRALLAHDAARQNTVLREGLS
jgi:Uma2 family endonuclease